MNENELDKLTGIFYNEAPYDYVLDIDPKPKAKLYGVCVYDVKLCVLYGRETYYEALFTLLHEIAHATIRHTTHSDVWEKEFVRLLRKYNFPKQIARDIPTIMGPNVKEWING